MALKIDLTGRQVNYLKVIRGKTHRYSDGVRWIWFCRCVCGKSKWLAGRRLSAGTVISCGCRRGKHNKSYSKIYLVWKNMIERCRNKNNPGFKSYGGRGIKVCNRWYDFSNFYADMGDQLVGYSLERIDNDGNYEKTNCRWATAKEQAHNRRTTKMSYNKASEMRHLYAEGASKNKISRWYGVSQTTTFEVLAGHIWVK